MEITYAPASLSVGADAHIGPFGSCKFAGDYRKTGVFCRADAGIGPCNEITDPPYYQKTLPVKRMGSVLIALLHFPAKAGTIK